MTVTTLPRAAWVLHALLIPMALVALALAAKATGVDEVVAAAVFDTASHRFPGHESAALELLGHRVAKSAVLAVWLTLLASALAAPWTRRLQRHQAVLWATVLAMASGPVLVVALKQMNAIHCPWDLKQFAGAADPAFGWFVPAQDAGRCFPSGHAAGGFSFIALFFAGIATGRRRLQLAGLALALGLGLAFSAVRVIQGAHFVSHNLWSAALDWSAAALVFGLCLQLTVRRRRARQTAA